MMTRDLFAIANLLVLLTYISKPFVYGHFLPCDRGKLAMPGIIRLCRRIILRLFGRCANILACRA